MDEHQSQLQLCNHCDKLLPRRTVYNHIKLISNTSNKKRNLEDSNSRRRRRCIESSDEESEYSADERNINGLFQDEHEEEDVQQLDENESEEYDQVWDEESEEEIKRDIDDQHSFNKANEHSINNKANGIVKWILSSLLFLQTLYQLSNRYVEHILFFLQQIFIVFGKVNVLCAAVANTFPLSLYMLRKWTCFDRDNFHKYIVCPNCMAIYKYMDIVCEVENQTIVKKCSNEVFGCRVDGKSTNKGKQGKHKCDAVLVREVTLQNGKIKYYPLKVFCYKNITDSLEEHISRKDFQESCNVWRSRKIPNDMYGDIYDGAIWKRYETYKGENFLNSANNYAVMINVDWFQPYKRRRDISVGVLYMFFLNLPRHLRFKTENVVLLGIIPSLKKEPETLNSFLKPFVDEMKILEKGIELVPKGRQNPVKCKMLLLCAASDIPAARKLCGFMGHAAIQGCSFCTINFVNKSGQRYCGGYDNSLWAPRTREEHIRYSKQAENAKTMTKKKHIERTHGYKFTQLLQLEYFNPSLFCVVEPMHNLFLGTAKRMFCHWVDKEILTKSKLEKIGHNISEVNVSSDIGRIPSNISTNHGQFTADEWKNWVLIYSLYALHDVLPLQHLKVWQTFVLACYHICRTVTKESNVKIAQRLFLKFCKEVEEIYGGDFITPNIHLHCHLQECIRNFGSVYGFWAFSFERYNGLLSDFPTNKRSVEIQIMRKFSQVGFAKTMTQENFGEQQELFEQLIGKNKIESVKPSSDDLQLASDQPLDDVNGNIWCDLSLLMVNHEGYILWHLDNDDKHMLLLMYKTLYGENVAVDDLGSFAKKFSTVHWDSTFLGSKLSARGSNSKTVLAKWTSDLTTVDAMGDLRPGVIKHYIMHGVEIGGECKSHILAVVDWYKRPEHNHNLNILSPTTVWSTRTMNNGPASFIPVQRIYSKCAWTVITRRMQKFLNVCPLPQSIFI